MRLRKALFSLWFLLVCVLVCHQAAFCAPAATATVLAASGTLNVQRIGQKQVVALPVRAALHNGDIVSTGANGRANLLFNDGSRAILRENSRLEITSPAVPKQGTSLFRALLGGIWSRLRPGRGAKTVFTNLVVRGTEFYIDVAADGTTTLTVLDGTVDFSNKFGAVAVNAAQQSVAEPGKAPTIPITIATPGLIVEWTQDIDFAAVPREKFWTTSDNTVALRNSTQLRAANANAMQIGEALFDAGDAQGALAQFAAPDANSQLHRGYALLKLARLDEAETSFRGAVADGAFAEAARVGLAWTMLERNKPQQARDFAAPVVQANGANSEARIALAVALMRSPQVEGQDNLQAAVDQLKAATTGAENWRYQAHAWLAAAYLAQGKTEEAQREAESAAQMAPSSILAQSQLAQVSFFNNQTAQALRAAKRVAALDNESPGGQMALAQANLAAGRIDDAASAAARAVALDSKSPQANYLLGVADAARRDYRHAISSLRTSLQLAPEFYPALNALARVYVRAGREKEASTLLAQYENRPENAQILAARGEYYYNTGQYKKALADYRRALELNPGSALTWANAARTAIDDNQLSEAISAGQQAVKLAPDVGAYHSILGLAYRFSRLQGQAERSYRTALTLDPNNALALVELGFLQNDGDPRITERTNTLAFLQGFLLDPAISSELLRRGQTTEITPQGGPDNQRYAGMHRVTGKDGNFNFHLQGFSSKDDGDVPNAKFNRAVIQQNSTYQANARTTVFSHYLQRRDTFGLAGSLANSVNDDRGDFGFHEGVIATRYRFGSANLWAGVFASSQKENRLNPNGDYSFIVPLRGGLSLNAPALQVQTKSDTFSPELRFDYTLGNNPGRPRLLTLGYARPNTQTDVTSNLSVPPRNPSRPPLAGTLFQTLDSPVRRLYMQWDGRINENFSLTAQVRHERQAQLFTQKGKLIQGGFELPLDTDPQSSAPSRILPSLIANYRSGRSNNFRFMAKRRMTDFTSSVFAPIGTLLEVENDVSPTGFANPVRNGDLHQLELDAEHYYGRGGLAKLFMFHTTGRNVTYDFSQFINTSDLARSGAPIPNALEFDNLRRSGIGLRIEQQIRHGLFFQAAHTHSRTTGAATLFDPQTGDLIPAIYNGQAAPYHPNDISSLGLQYIAPTGLKMGANLKYSGAYFADLNDPAATTRPRVGGSTTVDFLLAHEPSPRAELFLQVLNAFDKRRFVFNGVPLQGRRIILGATRRF